MTNTETAALARIRQMADYWEQHLPEVIRTPAVVSALRAALEPVVVEPPADRAALRQRIADKLTADAYECDGKCGLSERECYDAHPITFSARCNGVTHVDAPVTAIAAAVLAVLPEPADRAAVLHTAADALDRYVGLQSSDAAPEVYGARMLIRELRRMADETPDATTAGHSVTPPVHYRRDDGVACCVHTIPVGPNSCPACRELADDEPAAGPTIVDQVVAVLQARAEALSVEADQEMRRDLEEQAQVWHEAADLARRTARKAARSQQPAADAPQDGARPSV